MTKPELPASRPLSIALGTPDLQSCRIKIESYTGDTLSVAYRGLPGNQSFTYGNFVAVWESTVIPWSTPPLATQPISSNSPSGTAEIGGLTITKNSYIVGYAVGPETAATCASAILNVGGLTAAPSSVEIGLNNVGTHSISVSYRALSGYLPQANGNWVGLWRGHVSPYNAPETPLAEVAIPTNSTEGNLPINGVPIAIKSTYTLIYFIGKSRTEAAAILTFDTADLAPCWLVA